MANPARAYLATQVGTTSQGELLIMLYEAAIKFLKRAKIEIENKDYAKKGIYISKALAIIHELSESLNKEKGGNITPTLLSLYQFCSSQLIKANIRLDTKRVDDVIRILDGIRSAYAQIVPLEDGKAMSGISSQAQAAQIQAAQAQAMQIQAEQEQAEQAQSGQPSAGTPAAPAAMQTKYGRPMPKAGYGLGNKPFGQPRPQPTQAPVVPAAPAPAPPAPAAPTQAAPAPTVPTTPPPAAAQPAPQPAAASPAPPPPTAPAHPAPAPKMRNAFNAAKLRAANAYTNNS